MNSKAAKWASKPLEDLLKELGTDLNKGVSSTEAEERLEIRRPIGLLKRKRNDSLMLSGKRLLNP